MIKKTFLLLCSLALLSCTSNAPEKKLPDSIDFHTEKIEEKMFHNSHLQMSFYIEDLQIDSSYLSREILENKIRENLLTNNLNSEGFYVDYPDMINKMKAEYLSLESESETDQAWEFSQSVEVVLNQNGLFGLQSSHYTYTGGAHGNTYLAHQTYRLEDQSLLALDSLILPAEKAHFTAYCESAFRKEREIEPTESLGSHGFWFKEDVFYLPTNFRYSPKGLSLYFNNYEIAPYAYGIIEIAISSTEIAPFVKNEYLLQINEVEGL
jgi:hypothetical protein